MSSESDKVSYLFVLSIALLTGLVKFLFFWSALTQCSQALFICFFSETLRAKFSEDEI